MSTPDIAAGVDAALASVFNIQIQDVPQNISHYTYAEWDSAAYLMVIMAIEERFDVQFTLDEIETAMGRAELIEALQSRT